MEESDDNMVESQFNVTKKPHVGMKFSSTNEAYAFYNEYAKKVGFSVRKDKSAYPKNIKEIMNKYFVCWKEGTSSLKGTQRIHAIDRENCKAKLVLLKKRGCTTWMVSQFVEEHSHVLTTPKRVGMLRSHREVSAAKKQLIMEFSEVNIPLHKQIALYEVQSGGIQNIGCTEMDIYNYRRDLRKQAEGHGVELLEEHFKNQISENSSFYFKLDLNEENVLDKCFWADSFSRGAYGCYGDVIVFDTTYNTNRYDMKFAPFVGVNKHGQTIVFACAFLSNETTSSFVWAFEQFKLAMPGADPEAYILKRWTKDADVGLIFDDNGSAIHNGMNNSLVMHKSKLSKLASQLVNLALLSETATMSLYQYLEKGLEDLKKFADNPSGSVAGSTSICDKSTPCRDPTPARGLGSGKRLKNPKEVAMQSSKRHCTLCRKTGHDKRNCPLVVQEVPSSQCDS